jgi:phage tail-like protein
MDGDRGYLMLSDPDQWARCSHSDTALLDGGGVQLAWDQVAGDPVPAASGPAGLAFDRWCSAYRSQPANGRVVAIPVGAGTGSPGQACDGVLGWPQGLDVDGAQRLYVAEAGSGRVAVVDLWARRLLRRIPVRSGHHPARRPVDVAAGRCLAYVLVQQPAGILVVQGRRGPRPGPVLLRPRVRTPMTASRLAASPGGVLVLWRQSGGDALVATADGVPVVSGLAGASDLAVTADGVLVVGGAGGPLRRFRPEGDGWLELEPLAATGFDGGAIAVAPDGRIAFTTAAGIGWTGGPQTSYRRHGRVVGYRLDSGSYGTRWGRVFLDACLPPGTRVGAGFLTSDEDDVPDPLPWRRAERSFTSVYRRDLSPPLPATGLAGLTPAVPLYRRPTGREGPWAQIAADDEFETYEAPVPAAPGRYLWVVLDLWGTTVATPRVRELRVERPGQGLLGQLPRSWSREEGDADFLQRFLAPAEGLVHELDQRAARRELLVDPRVVPQEALSWLAGFAGLVLDRRWPEAARRRLVAEAYRLFQRRGTPGALRETLAIYLGRPPVILETWRLRGIPGAILGRDARGPASSVLGAGMRAGGAAGTAAGTGAAVQDGYRTAAHRFSVLVPMDLTTEQLDVVRSIVERHKPAHTAYEVCELGLGMRVGRHLHVDLTSVVGPGSGWGPAVVGQVAVGGDGVVGVPAVGSRLGENSVAGAVRVG